MQIPSNQNLKFFECCIPVKGYARSIIYDLNRYDYDFIPNHLYDFLINNDKKIVDLERYEKSERELMISYIDFLLNKDYIFFCEENEIPFFKPLSLEWDFPSTIVAVVAEIGNEWTDDEQVLLLNRLREVNCLHLQLYSESLHELIFFTSFLEKIQESNLRSLEIIIPYYESLDEVTIKDLLFTYIRVKNIIFYNAPSDRSIQIGEYKYKCFYIKKDINFDGYVDYGYFQVNVQLFTEAHSHNTYFNRKVFIDKNLNVKNSAFSKKEFENLRDEKLSVIVKKPDFQKLWNIHKDQVDVCKDCEFRYMCVDSRIPLQRDNGSWFYPIECNYNPYIAKWRGEEGYISLIDCGVICNSDEYHINFNQIGSIIDIMYSEVS